VAGVLVSADVSGHSNTVQDSNGTLWLVLWKTAAPSTPHAYYSQDRGATWTDGGALTPFDQFESIGSQANYSPVRLLRTGADEFIVVDSLRVQVYSLATATSWALEATDTASTSHSTLNFGACAYPIDDDTVELHIVYPVGGRERTLAKRYNRSTGALVNTDGAIIHAFAVNTYPIQSGDVTYRHDGAEWSDTKPDKVVAAGSSRATNRRDFWYWLAAPSGDADWTWSGSMQVNPSSVGQSSEQFGFSHLTYNPRIDKALYVSGRRDINGTGPEQVAVAEYDFSADMWTNLAWTPLTDVEPQDYAGGGYDADDNVHVIYRDGPGADIRHDTWDRASSVWASEVWEAVAGEFFNVNHDSPATNAVRFTYLAGGDLYYDAVSFNQPPTVPTLVSPIEESAADATQPIVFRGVFNDPDVGDTLGGIQIRIDQAPPDSYLYWDGDSLEAAPAWFDADAPATAGGEFTFTLPAGELSQDLSTLWSFNTRDAAGEESGFATDAEFWTNPPPSLTVTAPVDPATVTRPDVTLSSPQAPSKQRHHIRIITDDVYTADGFDPASSDAVWDSTETVSTSMGPFTPTVDLVHLDTYRAYARIYVNLFGWSDWEHAEFTVELPTPDAATLTASPDPDGARALLSATGNHDEGDFPGSYARFQRLVDGVWTDVLGGAEVLFVGGQASIYDEEILPGAETTWRVLVVWDNDAGSILESDPSNLATATVDTTADILKDLHEGESLAVHIAEFDITDPGADTVHQVINRPDAVVVSDTRRMEQGTISFRTDTLAERDALTAMLDRDYPLLLQTIPDGDVGESRFVRFYSDRSRSRVTIVPNGVRRISQSWVAQPRPDMTDDEGS
jgi:hypothetical protein